MNTEKLILESREDSSVNFIAKGDFPGFIEARYIRRTDKYFVVYLSSQTGCKQACRMCHLTATGQTSLVDVTPAQFVRQAQSVLGWYDKQHQAEIVHYNFMARGEVLENKFMLSDSAAILRPLETMARGRSLFPKYLVSTIMPKSLAGKKLKDIFPTIHPEIYYSIYSIDPDFRRKWLIKSLPAEESLRMLLEWQQLTAKIPKLHWAFIQGENDSERDVEKICTTVNNLGLRVDVNIVRYNPYSEKYGMESNEETIYQHLGLIKSFLPLSKVQIITRVGFDVKASCGMFIKK